MNSSGLLQALHGRGRGSRLATLAVTVWLLGSLLVSLQPCCALFISLFGQHDQESTHVIHGVGHGDEISSQVSSKDKNYCGDGASVSTDLAKALPAVPGNPSSSSGVAVFATSLLSVFAVVPHLIFPSAYNPSPPPFRRYLRFLHLLI